MSLPMAGGRGAWGEQGIGLAPLLPESAPIGIADANSNIVVVDAVPVPVQGVESKPTGLAMLSEMSRK